MSFALALAPKNIDKLVKANLIPQKGAAETIVQGIHSTAQGMMSSTDHLIMSCLKFGVIDVLALYISTQLQDILLGVPTPKEGKIGLDVLEKTRLIFSSTATYLYFQKWLSTMQTSSRKKL